jgi:BirA family biotin operon repressor/biotin-[acetyl-CoA-carboxylase] ligase
LALADTLASYSIETKRKWTNDVYIGNKKIAGILIEHKLQGNTIGRTIAGIGLNVNQTQFSADLPNPTSMAKEQGTEFDRDEVLGRLQECIMKRYAQLQNGERETLQSDYHSMLYRLNEQHCYALPDGSRVQGIIRGVEPTGALKVEDENGKIGCYLFKEIEFLLKS